MTNITVIADHFQSYDWFPLVPTGISHIVLMFLSLTHTHSLSLSHTQTQLPSYQTTPHESTIHPNPDRSKADFSLHKNRSDHSISSNTTSRVSTCARPPLTSQATVLRSVYIQDTGWASQVLIKCIMVSFRGFPPPPPHVEFGNETNLSV